MWMTKFEQVYARLDRIESEFRSRFDRLEHQFNRLQAKMEVMFVPLLDWAICRKMKKLH